MSNLVDHAKRELAILGMEEEEISGYCKVIGAFAEMGHSGSSGAFAIPVIEQLLQFKNLTPLTEDPDEWVRHDDVGMWQSIRDFEAFSPDGGKHYFLLSEGGNFDSPRPLHKTKEKT